MAVPLCLALAGNAGEQNAPGANLYIKNQSASPQAASVNISGNATIGGVTATPSLVAGSVLSGNPNGVIELGGVFQSTGGNPRGVNAVDFQVSRQSADLVASGDYSVIAGGSNNIASGLYAVVGGGRWSKATGDRSVVAGGNSNAATNFASTVSGGLDNKAWGWSATVSGGNNNVASSSFATIGGGLRNQATNGHANTIAGGQDNSASGVFANTVAGGSGNTASDNMSTVGGGCDNLASGGASFVGGGYGNTASGAWCTTVSGGLNNIASAGFAAIGGGLGNQATSFSATIAGGQGNAASGGHAAIGGGYVNTASAAHCTVAGGAFNTATGDSSTVAGGAANTASGYRSAVGGGEGNTASGDLATVPGGGQNTAQGLCSFAAGTRSKANHTGAFVWADAINLDFASTGANEFSVRANGGVRFVSAVDGSGNPLAGVVLPPGGGGWSVLSDREAKAHFASMDSREVLDRLLALPIQTWNYRSQEASVRHIGPTAQDFAKAFGVGEDNKHISTVDADGVALAAIQGLHRMLEEKETQIAELREQMARLEKQNGEREARLITLEKAMNLGAFSGVEAGEGGAH